VTINTSKYKQGAKSGGRGRTRNDKGIREMKREEMDLPRGVCEITKEMLPLTSY
jgi:hypothetical protein